MDVNPYKIIRKHYSGHQRAMDVLIEHSEAVSLKALAIAEKLKLTEEECIFIKEASLLHDIGIFMTDAPSIGCYGKLPYICHGYLGHDLLAGEGLPVHSLVCERHTGTGLTVGDIIRQGLPLPHPQMIPV